METISISLIRDQFADIALLGLVSMLLATALTPIYTKFAYKYKWWKRQRDTSMTGEKAEVYHQLHAEKHKRNIPTMAGIITVVTVTIITLLFNLDRGQTWLPLAAMLGAASVGILDDIFNLRSLGGKAGLTARVKMLLITTVASAGGLYSFYKLGYSSLNIPFINGNVEIGWLFVPIFVLVVVSTANAVNITDGLDGLAGGLLTTVFTAYALIAFLQTNYGIAGFCITIVGALTSYTWFNIYPARFFMGDVGSFTMGATLGVIAMLTDTVLILPVIAIVFVGETGSVIVQVLSKKIFGRKIFRSAPIHHHFEAIGWPETKVTMRFWVIGEIAALAGLLLAVFGGHIL
ncbi:phospho-N-acetylmuramoyl-pentapeptide-transferase [Candidatus Saccharibacteria bacterium]|jgi:phospho-N-acetylmuramoyl-pentapeptide-transferase|nr:phospho-N-acetylmuramoyl-pentapeptide-transferase [Candidatus Saccharibacteria bacterium]